MTFKGPTLYNYSRRVQFVSVGFRMRFRFKLNPFPVINSLDLRLRQPPDIPVVRLRQSPDIPAVYKLHCHYLSKHGKNVHPSWNFQAPTPTQHFVGTLLMDLSGNGHSAAESPSMISMAGGMPNVDTFPIKSATFQLVDGSQFEMTPPIMRQALQYSPTPGVPDLVNWVKGLQERSHSPRTLSSSDQTDLLITNGSQDAICKVFEAMVSTGDNVLIETPTYSGTLAAVRPMDCNLIPVTSDKDGLDPDSLQEVMSRWNTSDVKDENSGIPKLLYLIPNGGNPTGHGLTEGRKKEIYKIAQKYDLMILEDDPYYYLQFKKPYVQSLFSMDTDGRVIRFDSFSKLISSGMRLGCVTGPKPVLDRVSLHMQASVMHASGLSQVVMYQVLNQWGYEGFDDHVDKVTEFYRKRKDQCIQAAEQHLTGLAEWSEPTGGMFLWLKLNIPDTFKMITVKARAKEVLFVPGNAFALDDSLPSPYVRASYSLCTQEQMNKAFERLAALIREVQD